MITANPFSVIVAFGIQGFYSAQGYFPTNVTEGNTLVQKGANQVIIVQSFITTIFVGYFVLTYRNKPKYAPSKIATNINEHFAGASLWKEAANMMKMKNFMLLCISFSILYAVDVSIGVCASPILSRWNYSPAFISIGGILCVITGVAASIVVGVYLDRTKKFL